MARVFTIFSISVLAIFCIPVWAKSPLQPVSLSCEYLINPLGIDTRLPRLSWNFIASEKDQIQSAYEIIVSDNQVSISHAEGNVWSSGKINADKNIHIVYSGKPLKSFTRYYWRVRVYNSKNELSDWSGHAYFETAMLSSSDWRAKWIGDGRKNPAKDEDYFKDDRMPLFRREFNAAKTISSAKLYISGLGYYEAYLNGKKISNNVLDPGWTTYRKQVLYAVHDITDQIQKGRNVAGVMLGNGWWNPLPIKLFGRWDLRQYQETGRPCVKAEIRIQYSDNSIHIIPTDQSWQTAPGPIVRNNVYIGEHYDARWEQPGWNTIAKMNKSWSPAVEVQGPAGMLSVQLQPPVRITKVLKPKGITEPRRDTFIVDMGQNFAGIARIKVKGPAGTNIRLRYGEDIYKDGTLNYNTTVMTQIRKGGIPAGPGAPPTAWQEDGYTLKGKGTEIWAPQFTFHGFRYVEVTGWPGKPTLEDIEGLRLNADLKKSGTFSCSNEMFTKLNEVIRWTFLSNVFSVQSDCPAREKMGYGADMVVTANAFIYNFDMSNFYRKSVRDFANEQQPDGGITEIAPHTGIADRGYGGDSGPLGWQLAFPFLQKQLFDFYGDKNIIESNYDGIVRQMDFLQSKAVDGLFHWDIGDHEALDPRAEAFSAASFYYHHSALASTFAGILGKQEDSVKYARLSDNIKGAIVKKYLVPGTGRFDNATQAAQIFALWYDFSPEKEATMKVLLDEFARHNGHVSAGIFGVKMMFDVLRENNRNDVAYAVANAKGFPGWGHMLDKGATTLWETWEYPEMYPSQNHPMFGSITEWFFRSLLGINPGSPGFKKIVLKPQPAGDLTWAKGSYYSVQGEIVSDWRILGSKFEWKVSIPPNTTAIVHIPCSNGNSIQQDGRKVVTGKYENGYAEVVIGSGSYSFSADYK
ncbi:MAG: family 78 glycoside hydrolase catalytic domain [Cyclobacteriaceae bacterium]